MSKFNSVSHIHVKDRKHLNKNPRKQELGIPYRLLEWRKDGGEDLNSSRVVGGLRYTWKMQARLPALPNIHTYICISGRIQVKFQLLKKQFHASHRRHLRFCLVALWLNWEQKPSKT